MRIIVINGPNLNLLGSREQSIYGDQDFDSFFTGLQGKYKEHLLEYFQSNIEGEIIDKIQEVGFEYDGIVLNAGGYTHTSVAITDAVAAVESPVIEVHISNIFAREEFRQKSLLSPNCLGIISGFGLKGYEMAIEYLVSLKD